MGVVGPKVGSYPMQFNGTVTATTPYYPSDGRGGKTDDPALSFVRDADICQITYIYGALEAGNVVFSIYDGDGNEVWAWTTNSTGQHIWPFPFGEDGPIVQGNWYVETTGTTPEWNIGFKILESR